jgi:hypothetical protein
MPPTPPSTNFSRDFPEKIFRSFKKKYRAKERCRKKNSCKQLGVKKKFVHRKIAQPPPQISNGPPLSFFYTLWLEDADTDQFTAAPFWHFAVMSTQIDVKSGFGAQLNRQNLQVQNSSYSGPPGGCAEPGSQITFSLDPNPISYLEQCLCAGEGGIGPRTGIVWVRNCSQPFPLAKRIENNR